MADTPNTLLMQLSRRVANFVSATGLTHKELARVIGCSRSALTEFLSTGRGLSAERSLRLMQVLSASKQELVAKFGRPAAAQIVHFQSEGKPMKLSYGGSVAGVGPDLNDGDITTVSSVNGDPSDDELTDVLRQVGNLHRQALDILSGYASKMQKPKPNPNGTTEPARRIDDNTASRTPGPRPDRFSR
jgi:transcriptional regulator with XRE-family HTH domain